MGIFINGMNVAFFPNGDLVSNQSGDPNDFFNPNPVGSDGYPIEWNGLTDVFDVVGLINPGQVNTLTLAIADTSDRIFDSALFFGGLRAGVTAGGGGIGGTVDDDDVLPVSEPAPLALFGLGLGLLALIRRRRHEA
jgi:MYXO-CTERM domain-containing protein